jgi:hypothetical protein
MSKDRDIRRHKRSKHIATVRLSWQDRFGNEKFTEARSFDISESGLRIEVPEPVPLKSYVTLHAERLGIRGRASVRYCARVGIKYVLGLEFATGLKWKPPSQEVEDKLREADALLAC